MVDIRGWMMDRWVGIGECMHVWMDGWMDGRIDEWIWVDRGGWVDGRIDEWIWVDG